MAARVDQRQEIAEFLAEVMEGWTVPDSAVDLGDIQWRPDLIKENGDLLYVAFEEIDRPWERRLEAASKSGRGLVVVCTPRALSIANLALLQRLDARPALLDGNSEEPEMSEYESIGDLVASYELDLGARLSELAIPLLDRAIACNDSFEKGMLFEQTLCLILSQPRYFQVVEHRFKNETEEIDLVLRNRATGALAEILGGPLVLVSGKNQARPVGGPEVRALRGNMGNRRGRCSFGILASAGTLARTTKAEQTHATTDPSLAVAVLDGSDLRALAQSGDLDGELEGHLMAAVLN